MSLHFQRRSCNLGSRSAQEHGLLGPRAGSLSRCPSSRQPAVELTIVPRNGALLQGLRRAPLAPVHAVPVSSQPDTPPRAGKKKSKKNVDINGEVSKDLGNGMFNIKLENGVTVMAHLSGKIRQNRIKIVGGDKVTVELSPYDLTKGRITYRFRPGEYENLQNAARGQEGSS